MKKLTILGIPVTNKFKSEIDLPHLKMTVSDHENNPYSIQRQQYWDAATYSELVKTVPYVAFEVDDLAEALKDQKIIIEPNSL